MKRKNLPDTLTVTLFLTHQCNFRCVYCYDNHNNAKLTSKSYTTILTFIKKQLYLTGIRKIRINLFGGEPMLEFNQAVNFLKQLEILKCEVEGLLITVGLTTNGYLLTKNKFIELCKYNLTDVQITLDGFRKEHNVKRKTINNEPTWDVIMENLDDIVKLNLPVKIILRTNFDKSSLVNEQKFLLYCKNRFMNKFIMHFEAIKDWGAECSIEFMNHIDEDEEILNLIDFCRTHGMATIYDDVIGRGFYACQHNMKNSYIFDANLYVLKCTVELSMAENYVGKLKEGGHIQYNTYIDLWNNIKEDCDMCKLLPQCLKYKCPARYIKDAKFRCSPKSEIIRFENFIRHSYL